MPDEWKCPMCSHGFMKYLRDDDKGDWDEEVYECNVCEHREYVELPD